jgi:16S rRNA processing protein RimM
MQQYFKIGKLVATFGTEGQLILSHSLGAKNALKGLETLFVELNKADLLPYFITNTKIKGEQETLVSLEGIHTKEAAHLLVRKEVWLTEADFKKFASAGSPISLLGFTIIDKQKEIGEVIEVIEQPHVVLCVVHIEGKEALIPIHEDLLKKMDKKNRKLYVDLPEGLLDIYTKTT